MTSYIETRRQLRLQGRYSSRSPVYIQGEISFNEALEAFRAIGDINLIQSCAKGMRLTVWDKTNGWSKLESNMLRIR